MKKAKINIKRFDGNREYIDSFELDTADRTTVLEALFFIKDYIDPSLSFRVQCRASICGTCGVKIGDKHYLACKTKIKDVLNDKGEVLIEPMANQTVIKDLITDHNQFIDKLKIVKGWFEPEDEFKPVYPEDLKEYDKETDCILCGICYSACPVIQTTDKFSPINFVKTYRFWKDKNDKLKEERLKLAVYGEISSCIHCKYCTFQCPKEIPVEQDIMKIKFVARQKGLIKEENQSGFGTPFGFNGGFNSGFGNNFGRNF